MLIYTITCDGATAIYSLRCYHHADRQIITGTLRKEVVVEIRPAEVILPQLAGMEPVRAQIIVHASYVRR